MERELPRWLESLTTDDTIVSYENWMVAPPTVRTMGVPVVTPRGRPGPGLGPGPALGPGLALGPDPGLGPGPCSWSWPGLGSGLSPTLVLACPWPWHLTLAQPGLRTTGPKNHESHTSRGSLHVWGGRERGLLLSPGREREGLQMMVRKRR